MKLKIKGPALFFGFSLFLGCLPLSAAQKSSAPIVQQVTATNPKYPEFYAPPFQSQLKTLVQGSKAETLADNRVRILEAKVQEFETNGETKLVIQAPACIYDRATRAVNSDGPLHAQTGDGKFMIDGTGFLYSQTNGFLFISNRVHTFVQADLLRSHSTNAASSSTPKVGDLEVASEQFSFDLTNKIATYVGNAKAASTNFSVKGGSIVVEAPAGERQLQNVTVETNVVMDYEKIHVEGQRAAYTAQSGLAIVSGSPRWRSEDREGHADELLIDPTNKMFRATGQAYLKFSAAGLTNSNFLPSQRVAASTNASPVTNRFVEISSDFYEFRTNSAKFGDKVALRETADGQLQGTMDSSSLDVSFTGTNELQSLVARTNVVIRQGTNQLSGDVAIYTAATGDLELTGNPSWQSGDREGKGESIAINPHQEEMRVRGGAWMRVPAAELGKLDAATNSPAANKPAEFADLYSDEYTFKPDRARFLRRVRIVHPEMNWTCDRLGVDSRGDSGGKNVTMLAEGGVVFALSAATNRSAVHGTCERAEYVHDITVNPIIDRMEMTGNPVLETTNATVRNSIIILDHTLHKLITPGQYAISGTLGTNFSQIIPQK